MNIEKLMNLVDEPVKNNMTNDSFISQLKNAKLNHNNWLDMIEESYKEANLNSIQANANRCSFGQWYNTIIFPEKNTKKIWKCIGAIHKRIHVVFFELLHSYNDLSQNEKDNKILEIRKISEQLNLKIDELLSLLDTTEEKIFQER